MASCLPSIRLVVLLQGMLYASADVIISESSMLLLWKHECTRVFADRFTAQDDKDWFEKTIKMVQQSFHSRSLCSPCPKKMDAGRIIAYTCDIFLFSATDRFAICQSVSLCVCDCEQNNSKSFHGFG